MVEMEELEGSKIVSHIEVGVDSMRVAGVSGLALPLPSSGSFCNSEISLPSSISYHVRQYFVGMGFPSTVVDKAIKEHGEKGADAILNVLLTHTETSLEHMYGEMDVALHLLDMGFTKEEISSAIDSFGPDVPIYELADSIFARRISLGCANEEKDVLEDKDHGLQTQSEPTRPHLATEDHLKNCFSMGKMVGTAMSTSNDIIDKCREIREHNNMEECLKCSFPATGMGKSRISNLNVEHHHEEMQRGKKAKHIYAYDERTSNDNKRKEAEVTTSEQQTTSYKETGDFSSESHELKKSECITIQSIHHSLSKPPFFFYGNVMDASQETWRRQSPFLYGIEPEHVNTQFFSAFMRKEGYFHNLPRDNRFYIVPKPSMTIEDALPHTRKWWPSWDTRKQLSCISLDTAGVPHICHRLEKMLKDSQGILSKEEQMDALHQCKTLNLIWIGQHRLSPIEPDQLEKILGYPEQHTQIQGLEPNDRLGALKCCFQVDTLGYHLSVLKKIYPSGLRVLSVFSGIGGAAIALHRLGMHLKCVVSVEESQVNQAILRRWWQNTGQSGELRQVDGVEWLTGRKIESLIEEFGGFDLVIGGKPCTCISRGPSERKSFGIDMNPFHEFVRVYKTVRSTMGRKK